MSYLRGPDRSEVQLLPACLDDYVAPNAPARFIEAYVEGLDFQAVGFGRATPAPTGRPPYHPADLLKVYLYGYLNGIRSSRRLEAEAARNLELIWLLRGLRPDFETLADFRKDNRGAFKPLFKSFNLLCRRLGLFGAELVAIDGSKFKAQNNSRRHYTQEQLRELLQKRSKAALINIWPNWTARTPKPKAYPVGRNATRCRKRLPCSRTAKAATTNCRVN